MPTARFAAGCGHVTSMAGKKYLVVAGGETANGTGLDSTYLYDLVEEKWIKSGKQVSL